MVSTSLVLARPGTPTRRPWPPQRMVMRAWLNNGILAEYHVADGRLGRAHVVGARLRGAHNHVFQLFKPVSADSGHSQLLFASSGQRIRVPPPVNDCKRSTLHRNFPMQ